MTGWLDLQAPIRNTADIPVHRDSVGAMGINSTARRDPIKPYVYGASPWSLRPRVLDGPDYDAEYDQVVPTPKPKPKRKPKRKRKPKPKPPVIYGPVEPGWHKAKRTAAARHARREAERQRWAQRNNVRPSPGWKPMTGADIEDLLAVLDG